MAQRVLIALPGFLGDVVLSTPLIRSVGERHPPGYLAVLVRPAAAPLLRGLSFIDRVMLDRLPGRPKLAGLAALLAALRAERFDAAITPSRSLRLGLLLRLAGIPRRITYDGGGACRLYTDRVRRREGVHAVEREAALLAPLRIPWAGPRLAAAAAPLPAAIEAIVSAPGQRVAIAPGSVWATKRWLSEGYAQVAAALRDGGAQVLLVGSAAERPIANEIARRCPGVVNLCGATALPELVTLLARCSLLITNDSGPAHIAGAAGTPVVQIYGPSTPEMGYRPLDPRSRIVQVDLACRPCGAHHAHACPKRHFRCMRDITPAQVLAAAREVPGALPVEELVTLGT